MAKDGTVWRALPQPARFDETELKALFTVKAAAPRKPSVGSASATAVPLSTSRGARALLDLKRSNQVRGMLNLYCVFLLILRVVAIWVSLP